MEVIDRTRASERRVLLASRLPVHIALRGLAREIAWPAASRDLVEVATAVLLADRLVRRPRQGRRQIHLRLPVRHPRIWRRQEPALRDALSFLTDDDFSFEFDRAAGGGTSLPPLSPRRKVHLDRVALFSGGLDSACSAARFAMEGISTGYVSHYTTGLGKLERLMGEIHSVYSPESKVHHAGFYLRPAGPAVRLMRENSRRSRSFLFVSLALATAAGAGASEVCVCENGPLALNLPLSPAMLPTRHAHSQFLRAMEGLSRSLLGETIRVTNPFELMTKGEMAALLAPHPELALQTVSCWYQQWSGRRGSYGRGHCGYCLPCLVRLASLESAGIGVPPGHFDIDVRELARRAGHSAEDLRRLGPYRALRDFIARIASCSSWRAFVLRFPEAIETEPTSREMPSEVWLRQLFLIMKRFAREVQTALSEPAS